MGGVITPSLLLSVNSFLEDVHAFGQDYHALENVCGAIGSIRQHGRSIWVGWFVFAIRSGACVGRVIVSSRAGHAPIKKGGGLVIKGWQEIKKLRGEGIWG